MGRPQNPGARTCDEWMDWRQEVVHCSGACDLGRRQWGSRRRGSVGPCELFKVRIGWLFKPGCVGALGPR